MYFGLTLYSAHSPIAGGELLRSLLASLEASLGLPAFRYVQTLGSAGHRSTPEVEISPRGLENVARRWASQRVGSLVFTRYAKAEALIAVGDRFGRQELSVRYVPTSDQLNPPQTNALPFEIASHGPIAPDWPDARNLSAFREITGKLDIGYGCIFMGADEDQATSEAILTPTYDWRSEPLWISDIQGKRKGRWRLGDRVRGAYWGNLISSSVLKSIGGIEALTNAGAARVEPWSTELVYVQATSTVAEAATLEGKRTMRQLSSVLAPVLAGSE